MLIIVKSGSSFGRSTQNRDRKEWFSFEESVEIQQQTDLQPQDEEYQKLHTEISGVADTLVRTRLRKRLLEYNRRQEASRG